MNSTFEAKLPSLYKKEKHFEASSIWITLNNQPSKRYADIRNTTKSTTKSISNEVASNSGSSILFLLEM